MDKDPAAQFTIFDHGPSSTARWFHFLRFEPCLCHHDRLVESFTSSSATRALDFIGRFPEPTIDLGGSIIAPRWYRRMTHINLPDAHVGYAVLDIQETAVELQTFTTSVGQAG
jgi:hypothetical protein